jgi:hypothetical protein
MRSTTLEGREACGAERDSEHLRDLVADPGALAHLKADKDEDSAHLSSAWSDSSPRGPSPPMEDGMIQARTTTAERDGRGQRVG